MAELGKQDVIFQIGPSPQGGMTINGVKMGSPRMEMGRDGMIVIREPGRTVGRNFPTTGDPEKDADTLLEMAEEIYSVYLRTP